MTTHKSSTSRILPVWLMLLSLFWGMILPSVAVARQEIAIATEGDPTDGLDYSGGGGGGSGDEGNELSPPNNSDIPTKIIFHEIFFWELEVIPYWINGQLSITVFFKGPVESPRGNFK